jgi:hypothetical protein
VELHLYFMTYRSEALVASQLDPEAFGRYMAVGTHKLSRGNVLFFEVDRSLVPPGAFKLDGIEERCRNADGSPKRSKYVSVYRVLEHLPLEALGTLWLTTADGRSLPIRAEPYAPETDPEGPFLYQEICPLPPMVVSALSPQRFAQFLTASDSPLVVPRILFADLLLERDAQGDLAGYLPYSEPQHLLHCVDQIAQHTTNKPTKTVSRTPSYTAFYRTIGRGFFVGDPTGLLHYPFPSRATLEVRHPHWWRSAQGS